MNTIERKARDSLLIVAIPVLLFYFLVVFSPILKSFWYSLHNSVNFKQKFIGFDNYIELIHDKKFWFSMQNNFFIIFFSLIFKTSFGFILAAMMRTKLILFKNFIRSVLFFPVVLAPIVIGLIWVIIYDYQNGILNYVLSLLGMEKRLWLSDPHLVMPSVTAPEIWQYIGLYFVIFASGFSKIDENILDAASIDGAGFWRTLFFVTLPLMVSTWRVALVLSIAPGLKTFQHIFVMTNGGPGLASTVMAQYAYNQGVQKVRFHYASAVALAIITISLLCMAIVYYITNNFLKKYE